MPGQAPLGSGSYQQYGPPSGQLAYPNGPNQQYGPGNGSYQQYGPPSGQLSYSNGSNQQYSPMASQPPFYPAYSNNLPQKRKNGWKALFFIIPVILVVFASIFGPNIVNNLLAGGQPQSKTSTTTRAVVMAAPTLTQQQLQGIQQYNDTMRYKQLARLYTSQMTLDEEIGQLMVVTYNTNEYSQDLDYMLNQQHVGGVIMYQLSFEHQLQTVAQVKHDIGMMQQRATFPPFISIDEEGWNVDRLSAVYPVPPNPKRLAADNIHQTGDPAVATSEGDRVAHDMMALGINVNFAPDVDVATFHGYIDWDYRAFGGTTDDVLKYSAPYLEAMQKGGVIGTLKHFVGLGAVPRGDANDPHFVLPSVTLTRDQLDPHLATFKHFIQSPNPLDHPGFIMPTDLMVPAVDPQYPTEFSHIFVTDILRNQLGYDGVVITDGLQMGGVKLNGVTLTEAVASVMALQAGCDMLLDIAGSEQVAAVSAAIKSALQDGTLTKARIDESVTRIIQLKMERNIVPSVQGVNLAA